MAAELTTRELNRATLARQLLLRREPLGVGEAVRHVVALQAQHPASPYVALWNRVDGFDPDELDAAFADRTVVKATLMRITLHAVHGGDHRVFREAMQQTLYASRLGYRFAAAGLTPADAHELLPELHAFAERPRTAAELQTWLEERLGAEKKTGAWWGLKAYANLLHVATGGPWSFGARSSFVAAPTGPPPMEREAAPRALEQLVLRYLAAFGPASPADIAQFGTLPRGPVRQTLRALGDAVEEVKEADGTALFDVPGAPRPPADTPAPPRLLGMWDSVLLAHADRTRVIPEDLRRVVIRVNGDVLPTLLVDGRVAGVWRPVEGGVEATAFHELTSTAWDGLAEEARSLTALLARREPRAYSRYEHWWRRLPDGQVRLLPG
ncbi:winged helix DNA-binding domain-containing protein [Streptomyces sp. NPDC020298]|uniref:winged helix DNA-binding domain-containing protein n=1 Tax=unclassified Streptomyces TaxID=2593676 RepID=UPI0033DEA6E7